MPTTDFLIRRAAASDAVTLAQFAAQTFAETFGPDNRAEDMASFLQSSFSDEHQAREIGDPRWVTLLLEIDGSLAGYAQIRREDTPACVTGPSPIELYRFYVAKEWQGRGVAQRLMNEVKATAKHLGAETLWLGVWEHNPRAQSFYSKCGFRDVGSHDFILGTDRQTDRIMVVALNQAG